MYTYQSMNSSLYEEVLFNPHQNKTEAYFQSKSNIKAITRIWLVSIVESSISEASREHSAHISNVVDGKFVACR